MEEEIITTRKSVHGVLLCSLLVMCITCTDRSTKSAEKTNDQAKNWPAHFDFGKRAAADKIVLLDIDVRPDGRGLPPGSGTVPEGRRIYALKCASCHGLTGVEGPYSHLVSIDTSKAKTIGNDWPYATTVFDYIKRAMPFSAPGSLRDEEVYHLTAFLLHANKLIDSTLVVDAQSLPKVAMPARTLFVPDDRMGESEVR